MLMQFQVAMPRRPRALPTLSVNVRVAAALFLFKYEERAKKFWDEWPTEPVASLVVPSAKRMSRRTLTGGETPLAEKFAHLRGILT